MRVSASTMEHVFSNLDAVKYCILHQNYVDYQAIFSRAAGSSRRSRRYDRVAHVAPRQRGRGQWSITRASAAWRSAAVQYSRSDMQRT
jgi:hypothetical protein